MTFKIPFIQASRCMIRVDSYTILETKKVREIGRGHFASLRPRRKETSEEGESFK